MQWKPESKSKYVPNHHRLNQALELKSADTPHFSMHPARGKLVNWYHPKYTNYDSKISKRVNLELTHHCC